MVDQKSEARRSTGFLTDGTGKPSIMRFMSVVALLASIGFGFMAIRMDAGNEGIYITVAFLLFAFAPKAAQKFVEHAYPPSAQ